MDEWSSPNWTTSRRREREAIISSYLDEFKKFGYPFTWHLGFHSLNDDRICDQLATHGGVKFIDLAMTGSLSEIIQFLPRQSELRVERVENLNNVLDWLEPFSKAFELDEGAKNIFKDYISIHLNSSNLRSFVGYVGEVPMSSSMYFRTKDIPVIYNVGTLPEFRNQGFASTMVQAACRELKELGEEWVGLYSSPEISSISLVSRLI